MRGLFVTSMLCLPLALLACGDLSGHEVTHVLAEYTDYFGFSPSQAVWICYDKGEGQATIRTALSNDGNVVDQDSNTIVLSQDSKNAMKRNIDSLSLGKTKTYGSAGEAASMDGMPMNLTFFAEKTKSVVRIDVADIDSLPKEFSYLYNAFAYKKF